MDRDIQSFQALFQSYCSALTGDVTRYALKQVPLILPRPEPPVIARLFRYVQTRFEVEPTLLEISSPCIIIGDIHGQILDLFRILNHYGANGHTTYLFMGDLVDRGEFSVECLICVFLLKALWPGNVFVIRGNHEFSTLCSQCGFMTQMLDFFQMCTLYQDAIQVFTHLPLAALVDNSILCVHGGIGPNVIALSSILWIARPIENFGDDVVDSLVWSDPDPTVERFRPSTARGAGYLFGEAAAISFLDDSKLTLLVRAHECVPDGAKEQFGGRVLTVFSASNYGGLMANQAAVLEVNPHKRTVRTFPPIQWLLRSSVHFANSANKLTRESSMQVRKGPLAGKGIPRFQSGDVRPLLGKIRGSASQMLPDCSSLGVFPLGPEDEEPPPSHQGSLALNPLTPVRALRPYIPGKTGRRLSAV
jgi:protein phosphatase